MMLGYMTEPGVLQEVIESNLFLYQPWQSSVKTNTFVLSKNYRNIILHCNSNHLLNIGGKVVYRRI